MWLLSVLRSLTLYATLVKSIESESWADVADSLAGEDVAYQAETSRLMNIIVNSLYTDREVFLRELISNCADALEKSRIRHIADHDWHTTLQINVTANLDGHTLIIEDNGIGMCKDELKKNLGTLAKSGTHEFLDAAKRGESASNLIGQFGVGFYSVFLVGEKVLVKSKCSGENHPNVWISNDGGSEFRVVPLPEENYESGTSIEIRLKNNAHEFTEGETLRKLLARFSQFLPFPIYLKSTPESEWEHINVNKPLWLRDKHDISETEYNDFYKAFSDDKSNPLGHTHFKTDGDYEFTGLLFIPDKQQRKFYDNNLENFASESQIKLYVQRVLISDSLKSFLPTWLNFVSGVIDSNHLPLKVDRETFTSKKIVERMKQKVISKAFDLMKNLSHEGDCDNVNSTCHKLWKTYGKNLMLGCVEDRNAKNTKRILEISRFRTNLNGTKLISMEDYLQMMKPGQKSIFYVGGDTYKSTIDSGFLDEFNSHKIPVLILLGPYESGCVIDLTYKEYPLKSIEKDSLTWKDLAFIKADGDLSKIPDIIKDETRKGKKIDIMYKPLVNYVSKTLGLEKASKVVMSQRLGRAPAIVSVPEFGLTASYERLLTSQLGSTGGFMGKMKTLELNPYHPIIHKLLNQVKEDGNETYINSRLHVIYQAALISAGFQPTDPKILLRDLFSSLLHESGTHTEDFDTNVANFELEIPDDIVIEEEEEEDPDFMSYQDDDSNPLDPESNFDDLKDEL